LNLGSRHRTEAEHEGGEDEREQDARCPLHVVLAR